jgi:hypothetical protein
MANHVEKKELVVLGESRLDEDVPPASVSLSLASLPSGGPDEDALDGCVLDAVLTPSECKRMVASAEAAGFSFWAAERDDQRRRHGKRRAARGPVGSGRAGCGGKWIGGIPYASARRACVWHDRS